MAAPLRIGNCSGFYGDRLAAMREMLDGGQLDVLTGDYLAELTMLILARGRHRYARTFLAQLGDCLADALARGVRIVANAGGLDPAGCADAVRELAASRGLRARVAHVTGDDLLDTPLLDSLRHLDTGAPPPAEPVTANAYLGGWGIAAALTAGADVVVTGRVTDASLVVGPAAAHHGWRRDDYDALAGATVAGHILECGGQATGGNYSFFTEVPGVAHVGFPLAEVAADGSCVITKHPGTGGRVDVGTVTAQLLYEIGGARYLGPDVTTRFDTIRLREVGPDRVAVSGVRGEPPPPTAKVSVNYLGGFRNAMTFVLTGLDAEAKAALLREQLAGVVAAAGRHEFRLAATAVADPPTNEQATSALTVSVFDPDAAVVGRAFSAAAVELALTSYPGATLAGPPRDATPYGVHWPGAVPAAALVQTVVVDGAAPLSVPPTVAAAAAAVEAAPAAAAPGSPARPAVAAVAVPPPPAGPTRAAPLGTLFGARSGDKGGDANLGVWARTDDGYAWLVHALDVPALQRLLPEAAGLAVTRTELANLRAVNFVLPGLLGEGVAASTRADPQAKGLGEWLRARVVELPVALLDR